MNRRSKALASLLLIIPVAKELAAQDACANLFAQGYYDEQQTFSDRQNFKFVQATICSDTTLTRQTADDRNLGSGGSYYAVITGFLNVGDQEKTFEEKRNIFCSMTLDTSTATSSLVQTSRTVSQAATSVMKSCFESKGFHAAVIPSRNPESFAIYMTNHTEGETDITIANISGNPNIVCNPSVPTTVHSGATIICQKPADKTVQVTMNTNRGTLKAVDVLGTADINNDIRQEMKELKDRVAAQVQFSCLGCIQQSVLTEAQFQNANGSNWVLCDGRNIVGSKLARMTGIANAPDLRGEFLRGKNFGRYRDIEEVELGALETDTVGAHQHIQRVYDPDAPNIPSRVGSGIFWNGGYRFTDKVDVYVQSTILPSTLETRPKNVTVNFFYKVN